MKRKPQLSLVALIATSALVLSGCAGSGDYLAVAPMSSCDPVSIEVSSTYPSLSDDLEITLVDKETRREVTGLELNNYRVEYRFGIYGDLGFANLPESAYFITENENLSSGIFPTPAPSSAAVFDFFGLPMENTVPEGLFGEAGALNFAYNGSDTKTLATWLFGNDPDEWINSNDQLFLDMGEAILFVLTTPSALVAVCTEGDLDEIVSVTPMFPNLILNPDGMGVVLGDPEIPNDDRLSIAGSENFVYLAVLFPSTETVYATNPATNLWLKFLSTGGSPENGYVAVNNIGFDFSVDEDQENFDLASSNLGETFTVMVMYADLNTNPDMNMDTNEILDSLNFGTVFYNARVLDSGQVFLEEKISVDPQGNFIVESEASVPSNIANDLVVASKIKPASITIPNEIVTITGARLDLIQEVRVNSVPAKILSKKANRLSFIAPVGIKGEATVELTGAGKTVLVEKKINFDQSASKKTVRLGGMSGSKTNLSKAIQLKIATAIANNPGAKTLECVGTFTKGTKSQKALAEARSTAVCAKALSLNDELIGTQALSRKIAAANAAKRQVLIVIG